MLYREPLVIDIDGTLCEDTAGQNYLDPKPRREVIDKVNRCYDAGYRIIVMTARGMGRHLGSTFHAKRQFGQVTADWLRRNGVKYHELKFGKPAAMRYIDDKAMTSEEFVRDDTLLA